MPEPPTVTSTALRYPQGNAERATELHFQPGQHWCSRAPCPITTGTNSGDVLSWHNYQGLKTINFTHSALASLLVRLYRTKNCWSSTLCPADAGDSPYRDAELGWRCWELEARAAGLEANSQGTPSSQEARWLCALHELRQALGSGRHKPPGLLLAASVRRRESSLAMLGAVSERNLPQAEHWPKSIVWPSQPLLAAPISYGTAPGESLSDLFCSASVCSPARLAALRIAAQGFNHAGTPAWCSPPVWWACAKGPQSPLVPRCWEAATAA